MQPRQRHNSTEKVERISPFASIRNVDVPQRPPWISSFCYLPTGPWWWPVWVQCSRCFSRQILSIKLHHMCSPWVEQQQNWVKSFMSSWYSWGSWLTRKPQIWGNKSNNRKTEGKLFVSGLVIRKDYEKQLRRKQTVSTQEKIPFTLKTDVGTTRRWSQGAEFSHTEHARNQNVPCNQATALELLSSLRIVMTITICANMNFLAITSVMNGWT